MGKKNKNTKAKQTPANQTATTGTDAEPLPEQPQEAQQPEVPAEPQKTPEERAADYEQEQLTTYNQILKECQKDEELLESPLDMSEHQQELDSIQQIESKKLEKQLKILV